MKFHGYFNARFEPPAPFIRALVVSEKLRLRYLVDFLLDTGASVTILLDKDVARLGLEVKGLKRAGRDVGGLGGFVTTYQVDRVRLLFRAEDGTLHEERLRLWVGSHASTPLRQAVRSMVMTLPSLLGRDIISRFKLFLDYTKSQLYLESASPEV